MRKIEQLKAIGIHPTKEYYWNLPVSKLVSKTFQNKFHANFKMYQSFANDAIRSGAPQQLTKFEIG